MAHVALTGAHGFLGWHTQCALTLRGLEPSKIAVGLNYNVQQAERALEGASRVIHLAGVNRASDDEVRDGNILFARQLADALRRVSNPPLTVVYSNSTQAGTNSPYGDAKQEASVILAEAARAAGADFVDLKLPNLFGEHGRPFYNSVVATFSELLAAGGSPLVENDNELSFLHVQDAVDLLIGQTTDSPDLRSHLTVRTLLGRLEALANSYRHGEFPSAESHFDLNLLNTYRSYVFAKNPIFRGEMGASVMSSIARGDSVISSADRRGFERLRVQSGQARVSMRKLVTGENVDVVITSGDRAVVDLPTLWSHSVTNLGGAELVLECAGLTGRHANEETTGANP